MTNAMKRKKITFEEYQREMGAINKRANKSMKYLIIGLFVPFALIIITALLYFFSAIKIALPGEASSASHSSQLVINLHGLATKIFVPYLVVLGMLALAGVAYAVVRSLRCPHCRRFFPRGKLKLYDQIESTSSTIDNNGNLCDHRSVKNVYWTECKYCGKIILVCR